jgi:hypothetical protein
LTFDDGPHPRYRNRCWRSCANTASEPRSSSLG